MAKIKVAALQEVVEQLGPPMVLRWIRTESGLPGATLNRKLYQRSGHSSKRRSLTMLRWCAYCQEFQGETAPFEDFNLTHGICPKCLSEDAPRVDRRVEHAKSLRGLQERLMNSGKTENADAARALIDLAMEAGIRPVDVLMGLVSPALYSIGEQWSHGSVTVTEEHRFTAFCESAFDIIANKLGRAKAADLSDQLVDVILMNAYGNTHTLAIRFLSLWLRGLGIKVLLLEPPAPLAQLIRIIEKVQPTFILISVALANHIDGVSEIARSLERVNARIKPTLIVGGNAVKSGRATPIPDAIFLTDIRVMDDMILRNLGVSRNS